MLKKLPIGISTLKDIIEENYLYVDKTKIALDLIQNGRYYFLSRPRRFGKSLMIDTLRSIFEAKKDIFKDLYIYDKWDWSIAYPVIRISFNHGDFKTTEGFERTIIRILEENQNSLNLKCKELDNASAYFRDLIIKANEKYNQKVVILIDEYDKPILDNIENTEVATKRRDELKDFYSVIKSSDEYLKFVFITGVSKFSKVSLFSGLNNLDDITLDKKYSTICGYTQKDVETSFAKHLEGQDFNKIKQWYNGYKFLGEGVYNPFDILLFISKGFEFRNYWFSTATPTFLLKLIEKNNYFLPNLENIVKDEMMLNSFDVDYIELETLMWQTGYLTIDKVTINYDGMPMYHLDIPNQEVKISLLSSISNFMSKIDNPIQIKGEIYKSLSNANFDKFETAFKSLFASIPYNLFTNNKMYNYEGYYVGIFYAYLKALGIDIVAEDTTNKGRIDITLKMTNGIFVIEFKVDSKSALQQIKDKKYHEKYLSDKKPIYLVGIEFSKEDRNIGGFEWEMICAG
ncbi:MAG: ATP-binding protein [Sulfurovum sp.]|nr:ATP-binding protein [Sulfurovaceae bacterium]